MNHLDSSIKKILITGGAGFIGGAMISKLLKETNLEIYNIDKISYASDIKRINDLTKKLNKQNKYKFINIDLVNKNDLIKAVEFSNPDLIIHLAAESHVDRSIESPYKFIESNINGTFNLLEAVRLFWNKLTQNKKRNFKFIHVSTDEVFGSLENQSKFSESTAYAPRSPYSASKASSDHLVKAWHYTYGMPNIITNCSNNYGPWQFPEKFIPLVINKALKKESIPIYGDGLNIRDWLFVEDHVEALLLIAKNGKPGKSYCIGGNNEITNIDLTKKICSILDQKLNPMHSHERLITLVRDRPSHDRRYAIDSSLIKKELGWEPKYNFEESLDSTVNWYVSNKEWINYIERNSSYYGKRLG